MKPLQDSYNIFVHLCICPPIKLISRRKKMFNIFLSIFCPTLLIIGLIGSFVYFIRNFRSDLASTICAINQIFGTLIGLYTLFMAHVKRRDIKQMFDNFQTFYDASKWIIWFFY